MQAICNKLFTFYSFEALPRLEKILTQLELSQRFLAGGLATVKVGILDADAPLETTLSCSGTVGMVGSSSF